MLDLSVASIQENAHSPPLTQPLLTHFLLTPPSLRRLSRCHVPHCHTSLPSHTTTLPHFPRTFSPPTPPTTHLPTHPQPTGRHGPDGVLRARL